MLQSIDSPALTREDHGDSDCPCAAHGGPQQSKYPHCSLQMTPGWSGFWQQWWSVERNPCRSTFSTRSCNPMWNPHWSSPFLKDCTTWKGPPAWAVPEGLSPEGGTPHWSKGRTSEEEAAKVSCYEMTTSPFPIPPGEGTKKVQELGGKLDLKGREGWEKVGLLLLLFFTILLCYK